MFQGLFCVVSNSLHERFEVCQPKSTWYVRWMCIVETQDVRYRRALVLTIFCSQELFFFHRIVEIAQLLVGGPMNIKLNWWASFLDVLAKKLPWVYRKRNGRLLIAFQWSTHIDDRKQGVFEVLIHFFKSYFERLRLFDFLQKWLFKLFLLVLIIFIWVGFAFTIFPLILLVKIFIFGQLTMLRRFLLGLILCWLKFWFLTRQLNSFYWLDYFWFSLLLWSDNWFY